MNKKLFLTLCAVFLMVLGAGAAFGAAIINSGNVYLGINDEGHLNTTDTLGVTVNSSATGLTYSTTGDATSPGCLCEGWGVSGNGVSGYANVDVGGVSNLTVDSFTTNYVAGVSAGTYATSNVYLTSLPDLKVSQAYSASTGAPGALFQNIVTITNDSLATITDVRYVRVMDWDVPPTEFDEFVTIRGTSATNLMTSHDDGFSSPDPLSGSGPIMAGTLDVDFTDVGPNDHGAYFLFGFGDLAAGESKTFSIFYGATVGEAAAIAALGAVGAELYSLGQSNSGGRADNDGVTYIFGFKGVGGTPIDPIPEPGTLLLLGSGLLGLAAVSRKKRAA